MHCVITLSAQMYNGQVPYNIWDISFFLFFTKNQFIACFLVLTLGAQFVRRASAQLTPKLVLRIYNGNKIECIVNNDKFLHDYTPDQLMKFSTLTNTDNDKAYHP